MDKDTAVSRDLIRLEIAMHAMQSLLAARQDLSPTPDFATVVAKSSVKYADALIAEVFKIPT